MFYFSAMNTLGYAVGPGIAALLEVFVKDLHIENLVLDSDTAPGWCMACIYLFLMVKIILVFQDPPMEHRISKPSPAAATERPSILGLIICMWVMFASGAMITCSEVYAVSIAKDLWGLNIQLSALFLACVMTCAGILTMIMGPATAKMMWSDRGGMLAGAALGIAFCVLLFDLGKSMMSIQSETRP